MTGWSAWIGSLRRGLWSLADVVFPPGCAGCGALGAALCESCRGGLNWVPRGQRLLDTQAVPGGLDDFTAALWFDGAAQKALHRLKYRHDVGLAETLAGLVSDHLGPVSAELRSALVVPVPLSPARLSERGYNQAALLARGLAERWGLIHAPTALVRMRSTRSQVGLTRADRQANVQGAFSAEARRVESRSILLVDDTCTTGATLHDCARALKVVGSGPVYGLAIAQAALRGRHGKA